MRIQIYFGKFLIICYTSRLTCIRLTRKVNLYFGEKYQIVQKKYFFLRIHFDLHYSVLLWTRMKF